MEMFREAVADYTTVSLLPLLIPISYFVYVFHGIIVVALFSMSVSTCQSVFPSTSQDSLSLSLSLYLSLSQTHTFSFPSSLSFSMYLTIYHSPFALGNLIGSRQHSRLSQQRHFSGQAWKF